MPGRSGVASGRGTRFIARFQETFDRHGLQDGQSGGLIAVVDSFTLVGEPQHRCRLGKLCCLRDKDLPYKLETVLSNGKLFSKHSSNG